MAAAKVAPSAVRWADSTEQRWAVWLVASTVDWTAANSVGLLVYLQAVLLVLYLVAQTVGRSADSKDCLMVVLLVVHWVAPKGG